MKKSALIDDLDRLAIEVDKLTICHRDPHRFFEQRSEVVDRMRWLIEKIQFSFPDAKTGCNSIKTKGGYLS